MAKMFYTLEETAQKLGKSTDAIKQLIDNGTLQVFRDGDKMMFKCTQIDAQSDGTSSSMGGSGLMSLVNGGLGGSGGATDQTGTGITIFDSDQVKTASDSRAGSSMGIKPGMNLNKPPAAATGKINVFDPNEIRESDSMAATRADANMRIKDEDLALESVGSGSGLLDLTRETDDTSLGAELLDEIYPTNNTESQDIKMDTAAIGSTGIFDSNQRNKARLANITTVGESSGSGFDMLSDSAASDSSPIFSNTESSFQSSLGNADTGATKALPKPAPSSASSPSPAQQVSKAANNPSSMQMVAPVEYMEEEDPMGNLFISGIMACAMTAILIGLFAIIPAMQGVPGDVTEILSGKLPVAFGILAVLAILLFGLSLVLKSKKSEA